MLHVCENEVLHVCENKTLRSCKYNIILFNKKNDIIQCFMFVKSVSLHNIITYIHKNVAFTFSQT